MRFSRHILPALAAFAFAASASAQVTVINSVPYTIGASGKYQLGANLVTTSADQTAITIAAPNVILDLNGLFVSGPGDSTTSLQGVIRVNNVSNVTIRNGTVANNGYGILVASGSNSINHLVEDVIATRCLVAGIRFFGISSGSIVRRNTATQIGGLTGQVSDAFGILLVGGVRVEKNVVSDVRGPASSRAFGLYGEAGDFMIANTISNGTSGVNPVGIRGGKYQRNLVLNFGTPFIGGVDAGGNF